MRQLLRPGGNCFIAAASDLSFPVVQSKHDIQLYSTTAGVTMPRCYHVRMDMTLAIVTCVVLLVVAIAVVTVILVRRYRRSREIFLKFDTMAGHVVSSPSSARRGSCA